MINDFLIRYETELVERTTKEVTEQVTQQVTEQVTEQVTNNVKRNIAKNLKSLLSDVEIAESTGLSIKEVQNL